MKLTETSSPSSITRWVIDKHILRTIVSHKKKKKQWRYAINTTDSSYERQMQEHP